MGVSYITVYDDDIDAFAAVVTPAGGRTSVCESTRPRIGSDDGRRSSLTPGMRFLSARLDRHGIHRVLPAPEVRLTTNTQLKLNRLSGMECICTLALSRPVTALLRTRRDGVCRM